jgi:nucleoid-associated protein YgaU
MAVVTFAASPGDDLYRLAARFYGDPEAWTLIAFANPSVAGDPMIQASVVLTIPPYSATRANGGILASA